MEQIAQKMIKDLEKASEAEGKGNRMDNRESNQVVDAIIEKVKFDLENAEKHERNTLVDAIAFKVKKDLETNNNEKSE